MIDTITKEASGPPDLKRGARRAGAAAPAPQVDRLPPHSPEAEMGVLGCILLSPAECMGACIARFKAGAEVFYDQRHQRIYATLVEMFDRQGGGAVDVITLQQQLKDRQLLEEVGGIAYLASLPDAVPSAANLSYYADIVFEKYLLRKVIAACSDVVGRVYDYEGDVDALLDEVERDILRVSEARVAEQTVTIKDLMHKAIGTLEKYHQLQGQLTGLATGFPDLDRLTGGFHEGEMVVIAARPSMGKTSLALNIAEHVAVDLRVPVGVFSLEMTAEALALRLLCSRARVNLKEARGGIMVEQNFAGITTAAGQLAAAPLFVDDTSALSILQLRAKARRLAQQHDIKLFVIDYLQQMHSTSRRVDNRQQEIADISNGIKALAKELKVPVLVLSQLNRDFERDKSRKPNLADLRESGAIEQDADFVGILYKVDPEDPFKRKDDITDDATGMSPEGLPINLLVAKQRNGPTGEVPLTFLRNYTRFESRARISDDAAPQG